MSFDSEDLTGILEHLWVHLETATRSARPPFHLPTLCSIDDQGRPDARIVVLRRVEPANRTLVCHTDIRSPKATQIRRDPHAAWVFYDAPAKIQLRVTGTMTLHTDDDLAERQWQASSVSSRRCYLAPHPPGRPAAGPSPNLPAEMRTRLPQAEETTPGRAHFGVLSCRAERFDWLYLHHAGHRRAEYVWRDHLQHPAQTWLEV